ncbi:hypothetical protein I6E68_05955 [Salinibacterium sp. NSLL150]|uniref:hypothetical protein n=1 Tax=unclassified Salinibacterium TaxID=2632331 RepID=UPI0018CF76C0|nr:MULTISPECIES: hypothetical protein [unclassified Salinibacterium]MBH0098684.1 hypothetical protein [Salinibacterium sp. NSLL35]MBH0101439.1 hypothetical protein [Salinibacterium sp. NSLL150]MBH0104198.1 hypothetical protein [Salinibacterium sp. NSLL16]MBH0106959.1 hypothetical protein [Salinibacterium sp. NSLL17]
MTDTNNTQNPETQSPNKREREREERFSAAALVEFALERYKLRRSPDGMLFATPVDPSAPQIAREIRSLRPDLSRALWASRGIAVGRETLGTAIETLQGLAYDAPVSEVHIRSARVGGAFQIDLGDDSGRYVSVSPGEWELIDPRSHETPEDLRRATFRRTAATNPLPAPISGGSRDDLRELLGFEVHDPRWKLAWGWLVGSFFVDRPRPILWALGAQGSGKSTRARMLLNVVDPVDALGREPGKNERDDFTAAAGRYIPSWDNIGSVSAATSDFLCRLVTGVGVDRRELYSDDTLRTSTIRRSGVATSIVLPIGLGPDALERMVLLELDRVPESERRSEAELWADFDRLHASILGALLDDVAGAMARLSEATNEVRELPRMADYALVLHALDRHLDLDDYEGFAEAYTRSVRGVLADRAESDPLTAGLVKIAKRGGVKGWSGTAESLLYLLEEFRPDDPRAGWPSTPWSLSSALTKGHETLRAAGLSAERRRRKGARIIVLKFDPVRELEIVPAPDETPEETPDEDDFTSTVKPSLPLRVVSGPDVRSVVS